MPILYRSGTATLRMYADDHHPPHFHIAGPDFEVMVAISSFSIMAGAARGKDIKPIMLWARSHKALLEAKWRELNERG